ncbi:Pentapeptide repeat-containing protein [Balamuthia mandrillaris]
MCKGFERDPNKDMVSGEIGLTKSQLKLPKVFSLSQPNPSILVVVSAAVITENLLTFKDIQELQIKNQKLLRVVRRLSSEQETQAKAMADAKLQEALRELESLRLARSRTTEKVQQLIRQRDMYKALLAQHIGSDGIISEQTALTELAGRKATNGSNSSSDQPQPQQPSLLLKELQREFDEYRKEKQKDEEMSQQTIDKLREESSSLRIQLAEAESRSESLQERLDLLQKNVTAHSKEYEGYRARNAELMASLSRHQEQMEQLRQELATARHEARQQENQVIRLRAEKEALAKADARNTEEMSSLRREKRQSELLVENLQHLLSSRDVTESTLRQNHSMELRSLKDECTALRERLEREKEEHRAAIREAELKANDAVLNLANKEKEVHELREKVLNYQHSNQALQNEINQLTQRLATSEKRLEMLMGKFFLLFENPPIQSKPICAKSDQWARYKYERVLSGLCIQATPGANTAPKPKFWGELTYQYKLQGNECHEGPFYPAGRGIKQLEERKQQLEKEIKTELQSAKAEAERIREEADSRLAKREKDLEEREQRQTLLEEQLFQVVERKSDKVKLNMDWTVDKEDGAYFIDRNPKAFAVILEYLRSGEVSREAFTKVGRQTLLEEAEYFLLEHLVSLVRDPKTQSNETLPIPDLTRGELLKLLAHNSTKRLRGIHLCGMDLSGMDFSEWNLTGADLRGADLSDACLAKAILDRTRLSCANLTGAILEGATFIAAALRNANLQATSCEGANFTKTELKEANLSNANLKSAKLHGADLSNAKLCNANLESADLSSAVLDGADLTGANLQSANLSRAKLKEANLSKANLFCACVQGADLRDAKLCSSNLKCVNLRSAVLDGADLTGSRK